MEKNVENLKAAQEKFGELIQSEFERIEHMKADNEVTDFDKLEKIGKEKVLEVLTGEFAVAEDAASKLLEVLEKTAPMPTFQPAIFDDMVQKITVYPQKYCFQLVNGLVLEERRD